MKPSIGRIVHYYDKQEICDMLVPRAAIVTQTYTDDPDKVCLTVFYLNCEPRMQDIPYSDSPKYGHWSWPPKV